MSSLSVHPHLLFPNKGVSVGAMFLKLCISDNPVPVCATALVSSAALGLPSHNSLSFILTFSTQLSLSPSLPHLFLSLSLLFPLHQVTCLACDHRSNTVEPFWDLSLEFPERYHSNSRESAAQVSCQLTEMLAKFTETEALEGNIYACDQCNSE